MRYKAGDVVKIDKTRFVIERVTKKGYILFPHIGFFVKDCKINKKIKVKKFYELGDKFKCLCDFSSGTSVAKKTDIIFVHRNFQMAHICLQE